MLKECKIVLAQRKKLPMISDNSETLGFWLVLRTVILLSPGNGHSAWSWGLFSTVFGSKDKLHAHTEADSSTRNLATTILTKCKEYFRNTWEAGHLTCMAGDRQVRLS